MTCCKRDDGTKIVDDVDKCCGIRGPRCFCLPYDDGLAITAQILTIIAVFFSWIWWATFVISIVGLILFQIFWCCRQTRCSLFFPITIAAMTSLLSLGVAVYAFVHWKDANYCWAFLMDGGKYNVHHYDDDDYVNYLTNIDKCRERLWGVIAAICSGLWGAAALFLFCFVQSGRHARWEEKHSGGSASSSSSSSSSNVDVVELSRSSSTEAGSEPPVVIADVSIMPPQSEDNKIDKVL